MLYYLFPTDYQFKPKYFNSLSELDVFRKLYFKIKRFIFKRDTDLNPEYLQKLVYVQKYLDKRNRNIVSYNDYLRGKK